MKFMLRLCSSLFLVALGLVVLGQVAVVRADTPAEPNPGLVRLALPRIVPAVVGQECNIYFDNLLLVPNPSNYVFDVGCLRGNQQSERWTWTPTEADVGDLLWTLDVRDSENRVIASSHTLIRTVAANHGEGRKLTVLCVGDSLTHASVYTQRLLDRSAQPGNPQITLIGSHWTGEPGPNRHEGYGGWTARRFATHYTDTARTGLYSKRGSPFLYVDTPGGQPTLDFSRYCQDVNEGKFPDLVTIFLGPNDLFSYTDETIEGGIDDVFLNLDLLVEMIRKASPSTQVALMLPVPPTESQDAFGSNYASGQTRWQYKRNIHRMVERMLSQYQDREGIRLVPTYLCLDCVHNYPTEQVKANAASDVEIIRQNNSVHPSSPGYVQIGDSLFDWIKGQ